MNKIAGVLLLFHSSLITGFGLWAAISPTGFLDTLHIYKTSSNYAGEDRFQIYHTEVRTYYIDPLFMEYIGIMAAIFGLVLFLLAARWYRSCGKG